MKKRIALWLDYYHGNVFSVLLLIFVMGVALLSVTYAVGYYRFLHYTKELYQNAGLENSIYFMMMPHYQKNPIEKAPEIRKIMESVASMPGVKAVVNPSGCSAAFHGVGTSINVYDTFMMEAFAYKLSNGRWFDRGQSRGDGLPQVVLGGTLYSNVKPGDVIGLDIQNPETGEQEQIQVYVIGKLKDPSYTLQLGRAGTDITTNGFLQISDVVIFSEEDENFPPVLRSPGLLYSMANAFVVFKEGAAEEEKATCYTYLERYGYYHTYDEIMQKTEEYIQDQIRRRGMLPFFLLFVATMSLISVSVLLVYKKMEAHSIYYLCGCSRRRSFLLMVAGVAGIACVAGILNIAVILCYPYLYNHGLMDLGSVLIDERSILYIVAYLAAVCLIATVLPYLVFRKSSSIDFYRRKES